MQTFARAVLGAAIACAASGALAEGCGLDMMWF
jgi:hypothetical protein